MPTPQTALLPSWAPSRAGPTVPRSWELRFRDVGLHVPSACWVAPFHFQRAEQQRKRLEQCRGGRGGSLGQPASHPLPSQ